MSEITNHIEGITGVSTANTDFIESAQRFVVSKIPKELLLFAQSQSSTFTGGGGVTVNTDSVTEVQRNGYSCKEIPLSESKWAANSSSLKYATSINPVWWHSDSKVKILPEPSGVEDGYYYYINHTKIDHDSDLRNAVVFHAAASEFEKLASSKVLDWTDLVLPVSPTIPTAPSTANFGSDLTIGAVAPVAPSSPSFTYTDVSVNDMVQPLISVTDMSSASGAPTYTKPVMSLSTLSSIGDLSISAVSPVTPSISAASVTITGTAPTYTSPVMSLTTFPTITWTFPSVPVAPSTSAQTVATFGNVPTFTPPVMGALDFTDTEDLITNEEDSEMLAARISEIQAQIGEFSAKLGETQAKFNKENSVFQADVQEKIQEAQLSDAEETRKLQKYQSELQSYQGEVNKVVSGNQAEISEWQTRSATDIQKYGTDIQNALNKFNEENAEYQAQLQISIQDAQLSSQDDAQLLQDYSSKVNTYASEVNEMASKSGSATQNATYYSAEAKKYYEWANMEISSYIQNNSKMINKTIAAQAAQQRR